MSTFTQQIAIRGRGARSNASGRYEAQAREAFDDGWTVEDTIKMKLNGVQQPNCLNPLASPGSNLGVHLCKLKAPLACKGASRERDMAASIGLRVYQITAQKRRGRSPIPFASPELKLPSPQFLSQFVASNTAVVQHNDIERSWFFDPKSEDGAGNSSGYVQYGTFGFESNFINNKTKKHNYRRQIDDVEEIPLFYDLWHPAHAEFALVAFQSFQGRSCISIVMQKMQDAFETTNSGYTIRHRKLMPNGIHGSLYSDAPVKRLTLIKRNASSDLTDNYSRLAPEGVDFEVSLTARRGGSLGDLISVSNSLRVKASGIVAHDGIEFNEATAQIQVGGRARRVGIFGSDSEAGVIDLTEDVKRGPDGHPTFESLSEHSHAIMKDFYKVLTG